MTDEERPSNPPAETSDGWVTLGRFWSTRRVPGIDETPETTYVAPPARIRRRTLIVGGAIALASIAIGAGLVFAAGSNGNSKGGKSDVSAAATLTSSSTVRSTTTSTAPTTTSSTSPPTTSTSTTRAAVPASVPVTTAPTPRATADAAQPVYQAVALPAGVTATLTAGSCRWQTTGGGMLQASGTITSKSAAGQRWNMTMHWLQNGRSLAHQSGLMDLQPGESKPWSLTLSQPNPPADLACSLVVA